MPKSLGDRMKEYENVYRFYAPKRTPLIIRIDGKAFHTFTQGLDKPWDGKLTGAMELTTKALCEEIQGAKLAYTQSDEISILLVDYDTLTTDAWFDKNLQKIVSVSASIATAVFNSTFAHPVDGGREWALFDSRAFTLPKEEVCNYFLERQWDAERNSISALGQSHFSHKQLHKLNTDQVQDKLFKEKGVNWNDLPTWKKRGICIVKESDNWCIDREIPVFSKDRSYINKLVYIDEEEKALI